MSQPEPRWDRDYAYGVQGELAVDDMLDQLARRQLTREDKRKRRLDAMLYIEVEQNPWNRGTWKPSGIEVTESDVWTYKVDDAQVVFVFEVAVLRRAVAEARRRNVSHHCCGGSNPTRGYLLPVGKIIEWGVHV